MLEQPKINQQDPAAALETAEGKQARAEAYRSPWQLAMRRFRRSTMGMVGAGMLLLLYLMAVFAPFIAPYSIMRQHSANPHQPPQRFYLFRDGRLTRPYTFPVRRERDPDTFRSFYAEDRDNPQPVRFFVRGDSYRLLGLFRSDLRLFGVEEGTFFPLGTDRFGRDLFSRMVVGSQVSLTVGVIGIIISFSIGIVVGGISGYYGGWVDSLLQRLIEVLLSFPRLPILLALAVVIPPQWPSTWVYTGIVAVLAFIGWAGLARVVRGQVLAVRQIDYVQAARAYGSSDLRIILRHIIPNLSSYLVIAATLALPGYILGESALSFLGLGIKEPMTSWGLLLRDAQNFESLRLYPWLLTPGLLIVLAVLAFNFVGDALRDAADAQQR